MIHKNAEIEKNCCKERTRNSFVFVYKLFFFKDFVLLPNKWAENKLKIKLWVVDQQKFYHMMMLQNDVCRKKKIL